MDITGSPQRNKIHPHKFMLWVGISSMIMMFAGLTSAYIVKSTQAGWEDVQLPVAFVTSTACIVLSSLTMQLSVRAFKQRVMQQYRLFLSATLVLGILFVVFQYLGFSALWQHGVQLKGAGAGQFLYVIAGLHALHATAGIIVLIVMLLKAFFGKVKSYNAVPVEVAGTFWHFVDLLWLYLLIFFWLIR